MRRLAVLLALLGMVLPGFAAKRVTVVQLEQALASVHGRPDAEIAQQLSDLELTERLSTARFARLQADLPGDKARQALMMLADPSAFLDPPAAEIPATPAPDNATQRKILALTVNYVTQTVHQLPNFFATRTTTSFEDTPSVQRPGAITPQGMTSATAYQPLHLVGNSSVTVFDRDGHEVVDTVEVSDKKSQPAVRRLTTSGVFGPILGTVLVDAAQNKLAWSHWEQGQTGLQAVFSYAVPKEKSHYTVTYDSLPTEPMGPCSTKTQSMSQLVAYHGEMAIDPASGTILRLVLVADMKPADFTAKSGIVVEYGPVEIGGRTYFGPVKSVSSTLAHYLMVIQGDCPWLDLKENLKTSLNDVVFEQYHVFRADATVLTEREAEKLESQPPPGSQETGPKEHESKNGPHLAASPASAASDTIMAKTDSAIPSTQPAPAEPVPANPTPLALPTPASAANQEAPTPQTPIFKTTARDVVVDVVVTKSKGDPAFGLGKQDFAVMEDGKPQAIDFFEEHTAGTRQSGAPPAMPVMPPGARTNLPEAPESDAVNVLLIDTLNTEQQDQAYVHHQIMNFLTRMRPGTRVAIFMLGSKLRFVQGFTADTSLLLAALNDKRSGMKSGKDSSFRSRGDSADDAASVANLQVMQASSYAIEALQAAQADSRAQDYGARAAMTFEALNYLGHYLAGVPGRKNLIWFASSFPVIVFPTAEQRERIKHDPALSGYLDKARTTADLFTLSQIAVYPIGAEGMMVEHIMGADSAGPGAQGGPGHIGSLGDGPMTNGSQTPFHAAAAERANIVYGMEQLAASTGGKAYFNTNDINGAIENAINNGANYYTVGYSPTDKKMDGSYRQIDVKLANSKYKLAYRRGYNADDAPALEAKSGVDPLASLLAFGLPAATGVLYGVQAAPASTQPGPANRAGENSALKGPLTRYDVDFIVRAQDIAMRPTPQGGRGGNILIGVKAYDRDGNAVNWEGDQEALEMKAEDYDAMVKTGIPAHLEIDLPSNMAVQLVTAVYDWGTGKAGTLEIPVPPPPIAETTPKP